MKLSRNSAATLAVVCGLSLMGANVQNAYAQEATTSETNTEAKVETANRNLEKNVDDAQLSLDAAEGEVKSHQDNVAEAQKELDAHGTLEAIQKDLAVARETLDKSKNGHKLAEDNYKAAKDNLNTAEEKNTKAKDNVAELEESVASAMKDHEDVKTANEAAVAQAQKKVDAANKEVKFQEGRVKTAKEALKIAQDLLNKEEAKKQELLNERAKLTDAGDIKDIDDKLAVINHHIDLNTEEVENAQADLEAKEERLKAAVQKKNDTQNELDELVKKQASLKDMGISVKHENQLVGPIFKDSDFNDNLKITVTKDGDTHTAAYMKQYGVTTPNVVNYGISTFNGGLYFMVPGTGKDLDGAQIVLNCDGYKPQAYEVAHLGGYRWALYQTEAPDPLQDKIDETKKDLDKADKDVEFAQGKVNRSKNFLDSANQTLQNSQENKAQHEEKKASIEAVDAKLEKANNNIDSRSEVVEQSEADLKTRQERLETANKNKNKADAAFEKAKQNAKDNNQKHLDKIAQLNTSLFAARNELAAANESVENHKANVEQAQAVLDQAKEQLDKDNVAHQQLQAKLENAKQLEANLTKAQHDLKDAIAKRDQAAVTLALAKDSAKQVNKGKNVRETTRKGSTNKTPQTADAGFMYQIPALVGMSISGFGLALKRKKN